MRYLKSLYEKGITVYMILADQAPSPFTLAEFRNYLTKQHAVENLDFYLAIIRYREIVRKSNLNHRQLRKEIPLGKERNGGKTEEEWYVELKDEFEKIVGQFVRVGTEQEVNIKQKDRTKIIESLEAGIIHPEVLTRVLDEIIQLIKTSCLSLYLEYIASKDEEDSNLDSIRRSSSLQSGLVKMTKAPIVTVHTQRKGTI